MLLGDNQSRYELVALDEGDKNSINGYLLGMVYCWCKNKPLEEFSIAGFVGGINADWTGTPPMVLYERYCREGKGNEAAQKEAAMNLGAILRDLLIVDKRAFIPRKTDAGTQYRWDGRLP